MEIKLSDHVGESPDGKHVDHNQWIVFCDGTQVGYLTKSADSWLQCIVWMDEATKAELMEAVSREARIKLGGVVLPIDPDLLPVDEGEGDE